MGRIMAIDYGTRRVGIAVTDPDQIIATPVTTIESKDLVSFLQRYTSKELVERIILGYPLKEDGTPTDLTGTVERLFDQLKGNFPDIKFIKYDERYTSRLALRAMITAGFSKKARRKKSNLDSISATLILQSYMEERNITS